MADGLSWAKRRKHRGRKIAEDPWAVYASRAYLERHGRPETPDDLARHSVVQFGGPIANHAAAVWLRTVAPQATIGACSESFPADGPRSRSSIRSRT